MSTTSTKLQVLFAILLPFFAELRSFRPQLFRPHIVLPTSRFAHKPQLHQLIQGNIAECYLYIPTSKSLIYCHVLLCFIDFPVAIFITNFCCPTTMSSHLHCTPDSSYTIRLLAGKNIGQSTGWQPCKVCILYFDDGNINFLKLNTNKKYRLQSE